MTRERIEDMREVVLPFVKKRLLETNYEGLGESDAKEFEREFNEILNLAIKALEQKSRWIPVTERLPEDGEWAIFTNGTQMSIERYKLDALDHFYPSGRWFQLEDAVAWMPLPKAYGEVKE